MFRTIVFVSLALLLPALYALAQQGEVIASLGRTGHTVVTDTVLKAIETAGVGSGQRIASP